MKKRFKVSIDRRLCKGCSLCVGFCPRGNLKFRDGALICEGECSGCMLCVRYCPDLGISVEELEG